MFCLLFRFFEDVRNQIGVTASPSDGVKTAVVTQDEADGGGLSFGAVCLVELRLFPGSLVGAEEKACVAEVASENMGGEGHRLRIFRGGHMAEDKQLVDLVKGVRRSVDLEGKVGEVEGVAVDVELDEHADVGMRLDALIVGVKDKVAERVEDDLFSDALIVLGHVGVVSDDGVRAHF